MERKIDFEDILAFIERAINVGKYTIETTKFSKLGYEFFIKNENEHITIQVYTDCFVISGRSSAIVEIKHNRTERETLALEKLSIDIKELNEEKAITLFNTFFKDDSKPTDINDLDNEDD